MEFARWDEGISIQARDLEVIRFCLEMKFADVEVLNQKFFDAKSTDMFAARKRLQKLESAGLLKSAALLQGSAKKFYLGTPKGYRELSSHNPSLAPKPLTKLSIVTFQHDLGALKARLLLERQGRATAWQSERLLKAHAEKATGGLRRDFMPDGIFTSKKGLTCAFEFENKPKSDSQLQEKILRLKALMDEKSPVFQACLFICSTENIKKRILAITGSISKKFIVQTMQELEVT